MRRKQHGEVADMLALLRERMKMDVVFVSEFVDGKRVFRYVDAPQTQLPCKWVNPTNWSRPGASAWWMAASLK